MCRAFLVLESDFADWQDDKAKFEVVLNYVVNSYLAGNTDGYFLQVDGQSVRTLQFPVFLDWVLANRESISRATLIHGHLRKSTNECNDAEGIHGWSFSKDGVDYTCSHNGVVYPYEKHDSLEFFGKLFGGDRIDIDRVAEVTEGYGGWGVFAVANTKRSFVISKGAVCYMHLVNGHFLAINSNDDIHEIRQKFDFKYDDEFSDYYPATLRKTPQEIGILTFSDELAKKSKDFKLDLGESKIFSDKRLAFEDKVIEFSEWKPIREKKLKSTDYTKTYNYSKGNKKYFSYGAIKRKNRKKAKDKAWDMDYDRSEEEWADEGNDWTDKKYNRFYGGW